MKTKHLATSYHHNHDINCDCNYCNHVRKCINCHDELVDALRWALDYMELTIKLDGSESVDGESTQLTHDKIKQALAKAGE